MPRSKKATKLKFDTIFVLRRGQTPFDFSDDPEELAGPWEGFSIEEVLLAAGLDPTSFEWWDPELNYDEGADLWVAPLRKG